MQHIGEEMSGVEPGDKVGLLAPRVSTQRAADARRSRSMFIAEIPHNGAEFLFCTQRGFE
jgi:hypothetical protein